MTKGQQKERTEPPGGSISAAIFQLLVRPGALPKVIYLSPGFEPIDQIVPEESGQDFTWLSRNVLAEDREAHAAFLRRALQTEAFWRHEYRILTPSGAIKWVRAEALPVRQPDGGVLWSGMLSDVSEYKRLEAALQTSELLLNKVQARAKLGGWQHEVSSGRRDWTEQVSRIYELGPDYDPNVGRPHLAMYSDSDRAAIAQSFNRAVEEGLAYEMELHLVAARGTPKWVRISGSPEFAQGKVTRVVGDIQDITERRQAEDRLIAALDEADKANKSKSRFLAAVSHDLRQPLAALSLYVDLLGKSHPRDTRAVVDRVRECVGNLSEMLTDLLDVSKLDAGVVVPVVTSFSVVELLERLVSVHGPQADAKGLGLRVHYADMVARTDRKLYQRLLSNLLSNAIRYTDRGGVLIACRRHQGRDWIEIWDTGVGIAEDKQGSIFEEFTQLHEGTRDGGSGLGLSIVAKTAALLGLEVRLSSRPGRGSMFAITLPACAGSAETEPDDESPRGAASASKLRIALVDDHETLREALTLTFESRGHSVVAAADGKALLHALQDRAPDVVVSDYRLATEETGFDVILALRSVYGAELPALIVTGDTDPGLIRTMAERGLPVHYKPLDIDALLSAIDEACAATPRRTRALRLI